VSGIEQTWCRCSRHCFLGSLQNRRIKTVRGEKGLSGAMGIVVETGECIASDGRLGTTAGWHCVVQGMPPACIYSSGKKAQVGKIPKEPLLGWLELWAAVEIGKTYKAFNNI